MLLTPEATETWLGMTDRDVEGLWVDRRGDAVTLDFMLDYFRGGDLENCAFGTDPNWDLQAIDIACDARYPRICSVAL